MERLEPVLISLGKSWSGSDQKVNVVATSNSGDGKVHWFKYPGLTSDD